MNVELVLQQNKKNQTLHLMKKESAMVFAFPTMITNTFGCDPEEIKNSGLELTPHFIMLLKALVNSNRYQCEEIYAILFTSIKSNVINKINSDTKVAAFKRKETDKIGEVFSLPGCANELILVDIDINDDSYILVDISQTNNMKLTKTDPKFLVKKSNL